MNDTIFFIWYKKSLSIEVLVMYQEFIVECTDRKTSISGRGFIVGKIIFSFMDSEIKRNLVTSRYLSTVTCRQLSCKCEPPRTVSSVS